MSAVQAGSVLKFGGPESSNPLVSFNEVDHANFDVLVRHCVDHRGQVCYRKWSNNRCDVALLQADLFHLTQVDLLRQSSREATLAYYINALTLWGILDNYPAVSVQKLDGDSSRYSIFDELQLWVGDRHLSLNEIENENDALRPRGDARIHFALACATRGYPRLRNEAYVTKLVDQQLTDNAIELFSDRTRFNISRLTGKVEMSPILKWYREEFGSTDHEIVSSVLRYLPTEHGCWLTTHPGWTLSQLGCNWGAKRRLPKDLSRIGSNSLQSIRENLADHRIPVAFPPRTHVASRHSGI